jgi:hypothetical protein
MTQFTDDRLTQQREALIQQSTEVFQRWLSKHPEIPNSIATLGAFKRYMDFTDPLTEDEFEFAWGNMKGSSQYGVTTRRVPTPQEVREDLVEQICAALRNPDGSGRGGRYSDENLKALRMQMKYWTIPQLQEKLSSVVSKQVYSKLSVEELRRITNTKQPQRYAGYENLGEFIIPRGQTQPVRCDSAYLLTLAKTNFYEYRYLCDRYGTVQITARQQGRE